MPLAQVAAYIAQASATRAEQQVVSAEVEVPAEILRLAEESHAHLDALRRLTGRPALAQPWTDQESARVWSSPLSR